jgi:hypothetical protein
LEDKAVGAFGGDFADVFVPTLCVLKYHKKHTTYEISMDVAQRNISKMEVLLGEAIIAC